MVGGSINLPIMLPALEANASLGSQGRVVEGTTCWLCSAWAGEIACLVHHVSSLARSRLVLVEQRTSNPQIRCSSPGLLAALSRGLSRKRLQVSALPRQWIRLFNGLTV